VPTKTFFNLPQKKRDLLLQAAREEFSRISFEKASINQIIHQAGIPRGSFYMYFQDKEDLFTYLFLDCRDLLFQKIEEYLRAEDGDILEALLHLYDYVMLRKTSPEFQQILEMIRRNTKLQRTKVIQMLRPGALSDFLIQAIDRSRLRLEQETDFPHILEILSCVTAPALLYGILNQDDQGARRQFQNMLKILARGIYTDPEPHYPSKGV